MEADTSSYFEFPNFSELFILDTDASNAAIGAVLSQRIDGQEKVVAYASRALTKSEREKILCDKEGAFSRGTFCEIFPPLSVWKEIHSENVEMVAQFQESRGTARKMD